MAVSRHKQARATRKAESRSADRSTCDRTTRKAESPDPESGDDSYFGGNGSCFRYLVNQIPPHSHLIVPFAGHCAIVRNMRLPQQVLINDLDGKVTRWWRRHLEVTTPKPETEYSTQIETQIEIRQQCGLELLEEVRRRMQFAGGLMPFVYLDPPYLLSTRKSGTRYRHELTNDEHVRLLAIAKELPCRVMISGYSSKLYLQQLADWRHFDFPSQTRGGMATEHVWCNYAAPAELQDYRYLGRDRRERFKLQRRAENLIAKLSRLPAIERNAMLAAVDSHFGVGRR
jgi:DNA adenine methylase